MGGPAEVSKRILEQIERIRNTATDLREPTREFERELFAERLDDIAQEITDILQVQEPADKQ